METEYQDSLLLRTVVDKLERAELQRDTYLIDRDKYHEQTIKGIATALEGYSGADIVHVIERAKQSAFADSINRGAARDLALSDIEQAIPQVRPSVSGKMLDRYHAFLRDP